MTLAAAQITCQDGRVQENLTRATQMAEQAKIQGAQLVLFPEFMPQGYLLTSALWNSAEPFDGPTARWLKESFIASKDVQRMNHTQHDSYCCWPGHASARV